MKTYWDTSALLNAILEIQDARKSFDRTDEKLTRCHALAETFSHLTGGKLGWRMLPGEAASTVAEMAKKMTIVSLGPKETREALVQTHKHEACAAVRYTIFFTLMLRSYTTAIASSPTTFPTSSRSPNLK